MARIAALQAENRQLTERVVKLEEELVLARLHRFAPKSEKHVDRIFDEAEQGTTVSSTCRTRVWRQPRNCKAKSAAANTCQNICRACASNMT